MLSLNRDAASAIYPTQRASNDECIREMRLAREIAEDGVRVGTPYNSYGVSTNDY